MRSPGDVLIDVEQFPAPSQALVRRFYTVPLARCDRCAQREEDCLFSRWANRCMTCYYDSPAGCSLTSIESWYKTFPTVSDDVFSHKEPFSELWHQSHVRDLDPWMFRDHRVDGYPISLIRSLMSYVDGIDNIRLLNALYEVYSLQHRPLMVKHTAHVIDMASGLVEVRPPVGDAGYGLKPEDFAADPRTFVLVALRTTVHVNGFSGGCTVGGASSSVTMAAAIATPAFGTVKPNGSSQPFLELYPLNNYVLDLVSVQLAFTHLNTVNLLGFGTEVSNKFLQSARSVRDLYQIIQDCEGLNRDPVVLQLLRRRLSAIVAEQGVILPASMASAME
ncbi:hypothetical protein B0H16DRAFT_1474344 [Mycena metata]|uniref:Uncharacterized protein n=1 Tax=Mycena metata TaxID=1033252 RepID=A0AAD7HI12_9AGAR|nr:hypothetical protein B0H16DRAFT_1474344 [Mycena metata]